MSRHPRSDNMDLAGALARKNELLKGLNEYSLALTAISSDEDFFAVVVDKLKSFAGAAAAGITSYNPISRELRLRASTLRSADRALFPRLLGRGLEGMRFSVSEQMYARIMREVVGDAGSLSETSFGTIPAAIGVAIERILGISWFTGLALQSRGELLGTVLIAGKRAQSRPDNEELRAFAGVTANAMRRWLVEREQQQREVQYRRLVEDVRQLAYEVTPQLVFTYIGSNVEDVLGYSADQVIGHSVLEMLTPTSREEVQRRARTRLEEAARRRLAPAIYEVEVRTEGGPRWYEVLSRPHHDVHGEMIGFHGIMRDITERVEAKQAMELSERRYRRLFERITVGLIALTPDGRILEVNEAVCDLTGYTREDLSRRTLAEISARVAEVARSALEPTEGQPRAVDPGLAITTTLRRSDGSEVPVEVSQIRTDLSDGPAVLLIVQDISERIAAERERARLEEQLQQSMKMEAVGRLAGGIAHDFNNMLTAILANLEFASTEVSGDEDLVEAIDEAHQAAKSAAVLTRQLLVFSSKQPLRPSVVDVSALLESLNRVLQRILGEDVSTQVDLAEDLWHLNVDAGQLEQVIMNLAVNARDAMPRGGELTIRAVNVHQRAGEDDEPDGVERSVRLSVQDTGCGMNEKIQARIFEPFFTTKPVGRGTGLGLAVAFGVITRSGGRMEVESAPGAGTRFDIYLPAARDDEAETGREVEATKLALGSGERILVVEDDPLVRGLTARNLRRLGYLVEVASGPVEALERLEQKQAEFALLFSDVVMPGMSGYDLADRLLERMPRLSVLFCSGYSGAALPPRNEALKDLALLPKPYTLTQLASAVRRALDQQGG